VQYRQLGGTDVSISEIGFGCGGNAGLMLRGSPREQTAVVARALDLGINYFDNAPDYGNGVAEENLGRVLRELKHRPLLNSKVEVRAENLDDIAGHVVRSTEASLKRLGVDYLDVLQIHNGPAAQPPKLEGPVYTQLWIEDFIRPGGAIEGLQRLLRDGKARHVGFICRGEDGAEVRQLLDTRLFSIINTPYTLLNPTAGMARPQGLEAGRDFGDVLTAAKQRGAGAAIYSPLAGGFLTDAAIAGEERHALARKEDVQADSARRNRERAHKLRFLADATGMSLAQAAIRFVLMHDGVTMALGGFSDMDQLEEIAAVSGKPAFPADDMARLDALWRSNFRD
jgi:aryl-alcohol dehydrogenase-like predicted oxidoreductase